MNMRVADPFKLGELATLAPTITPVFLAGGTGTRLWPLSRRSMPKQFLGFDSDLSLFQEALARFGVAGYRPGVIVTSHLCRKLVSAQARDSGYEASLVITEPEAKNSAAALLAAAYFLSKSDPKALILATPCDQRLDGRDDLAKAVALAVPAAREGQIVVFGITPTRAETGYGWIEPEPDHSGISKVRRFVEKPVRAAAEIMYSSRKYLWNAGIFLAEAQVLLREAREHLPELLSLVIKAVEGGRFSKGLAELDAKSWRDISAISIDFGLIEKTTSLAVVDLDTKWEDLGDWNAVWKASKKDRNGVSASGPVHAIDCSDSLLRSEGPDAPNLVGIGLDRMIAVATKDSMLVAPRDRAQEVRQVADLLRDDRVPDREERPWGWFQSLGKGDGYQVKRLVVTPGGKLSLQSHRLRSEHWVVVKGVATTTLGSQVRDLKVNQSLFVPSDVIHRLENNGRENLVVIEVQMGAYLGEDDIRRYEDIYARV